MKSTSKLKLNDCKEKVENGVIVKNIEYYDLPKDIKK